MRPPWAKLSSAGRLSIAEHGRDVAAVFSSLRAMPVFASRLAIAAGRDLTQTDGDRLDTLAFLHDFGKCNRGFQRRSDPAAPVIGHCEQAVPALGIEAARLAPRVDAFWDELAGAWNAEQLIAAVLAHHGRPLAALYQDLADDAGNAKQRERIEHDFAFWRPAPDSAPLEDLLALMEHARRRWPIAFDQTGKPLPGDRPPFVALFAGLLTLADWIGSDEDVFQAPRPASAPPPEALADRVVAARGLAPLGATAPDAFPQAFGFQPRPAQIDAGSSDLGQIAALEAETGSGKTEAALWRFARLHAEGRVDGLYFALPTRGAATQLFARLNTYLAAMFGPEAPTPVLAIPGYIRAGEVEGRRIGHHQVIWDDEDHDPARWAAEAPRRFLTARIAVGAVDQALLAGLKVRHAHLRGAALSRSLLVVDEVHASDGYMTELLRQLLENHRAVGGHALLLPATLGAEARSKLTGRPELTLAQAEATPYPAVSGDRAAPRLTRGGEGRAVEISFRPVQSDAMAIAALAIEAAVQGAAVLVLRNTVGDVLETQAALESAAPPELLFALGGVPTVHHGRFAPEDRSALDARVEEIFGKAGPARAPVVLVGSQTLEMSLDIDADHLLTDLAPMDVLLQRLGRLHRHAGRPRPAGFERPRAVFPTPADRDLRRFNTAMRHGLGPTMDGTGVYRDLAVIEATWAQLEACDAIRTPQDCRRLVERATHPEAVETAAARAGLSRARITGAEHGEIGEARRAVLDSVAQPFTSLLFPDDEILSTRLGLRDLRVPLIPSRVGPFDHQISALTIPGHMARGVDPEAEAEITDQDDGLRAVLAGKAFDYGRMGLRAI